MLDRTANTSAAIPREPTLWLSVAGIVIAVVTYQFRLRYPFDDTFISFRYAEHLASGNGLVWNIGGPHCEGYTNFLFIVILAVVHRLHLDLLASSQILGLVCTIATGLLLFVSGTRLRDTGTGIIACILYFVTPLSWINAVSGMETSLFVMLCTLSVTLFITERPALAFAIAFLATLTRPEGGMLAMIEIAVILLARGQPRRLIPFLYSFVLPLALYALWKYFYFGDLLPNSFYVKVVNKTVAHLPGLQYVRLFLTSNILLLAVILAGAIVNIERWKVDRHIWLPALWSAFLVAFFIFVQPLEGLYDRFLLPAQAVFFLLASLGISDLASKYRHKYRVVGSAVVLVYFGVLLFTPRTAQSLNAHEEIWDRSMDAIAREIKSLPHSDSLLFAYGDAGYVVYQTNIKHLDLFGLNDTRLAHAGSISERRSIVISESPDLILLPASLVADSCAYLVENAYDLVRPDSSNYTPIASFDAFPFSLVLFVNGDSRYHDELKEYSRARVLSHHALLRAPQCLR